MATRLTPDYIQEQFLRIFASQSPAERKGTIRALTVMDGLVSEFGAERISQEQPVTPRMSSSAMRGETFRRVEAA